MIRYYLYVYPGRWIVCILYTHNRRKSLEAAVEHTIFVIFLEACVKRLMGGWRRRGIDEPIWCDKGVLDVSSINYLFLVYISIIHLFYLRIMDVLLPVIRRLYINLCQTTKIHRF